MLRTTALRLVLAGGLLSVVPAWAATPEVPRRAATVREPVGRQGQVREGYLWLADGTSHLIEYELRGGVPMFEGDIVLNWTESGDLAIARELDALREKSAGRALTRFLWPSNRVYYTIDSALPNPSRVTSAITSWEANTNLDFLPRTTQGNFVTFRRGATGSACSSSLGMQGGQQFVTLEDACSSSNVVHEIGHAVGLYHEQTRNDRDSYVTINWANIESGREHNFQKYFDQNLDGQDHGAYDFNSIMHYSAFAFSKNGLPTITRKVGSGGLGGSVLTAGDLAGIAFLYGAAGRLTFYEGNSGTQSVVCQTVSGTMKLNFQRISCPNDEARSLQLSNVPAGYQLRIFDDPNCGTGDDWTEIKVLQPVASLLVGTFESSSSTSLAQISHHHNNGLDGKVSCVWGSQCGNGLCSAFETCSTCPADCGACPCGNGVCSGGESCLTCSQDCGTCTCNFNGVCEPPRENNITCGDCCGSGIAICPL